MNTKAADFFVGEMMNIDIIKQPVQTMNPQIPYSRIMMIKSHLSKHHINAAQLAAHGHIAGAREMVAVHFPPGTPTTNTAQCSFDQSAPCFFNLSNMQVLAKC